MLDNLNQRQSQRKAALLVAAIFGLCALALIIAIAGFAAPEVAIHALGIEFEVTAALVGFGLILVIVWWSNLRGRFDLFEFPIWFSLNAYLQGVASMWLLNRDVFIMIPGLERNPGPRMTEAVILFGFGLLFLWGGYVAVFRTQQQGVSLERTQHPQIKIAATFSIWFLAQLVIIFQTTVGGQGYLGNNTLGLWANYFAFVSVAGWAAWAALVIHHFRNPTLTGWTWLLLSIALDFGIGLVAGTKRPILTLVWLYLLNGYVTGKHLRVRWVLAVCLAVIFMIPAVNLTRQSLWQVGNLTYGVGFWERIQILTDSVPKILSQPISVLFEDTSETIASRQISVISVTASVLNVHPQYQGFLGSELIQEMAVGIIPRIIWPAKPTGNSSLYDITGTYLTYNRSLSAIGLFADAYRAGGWPFTAIWFLAVGAIGALLYRKGPRKEDDAWTVIYFVVLVFVITYDTTLTTVILRSVTMMPLLWFTVTYVMYSPSNSVLIEPDTEQIAGNVAGQ